MPRPEELDMHASCWAVPLSLAVLLTAPARADEWQKNWRIAGRPEVVIRADDASVTVQTWQRAGVGIEIETRGLRIGPRGLRITDRSSGNRVELEARETRFHLSIGLTMRWTRILVHVPRGSDLDLNTGDGSVSVEPVSGQIRVSTGDGSIRLDGAHGDIELNTGDGSIQAGDLDGTLIAHTGDGGIRVSGHFSALDLETGDGTIVADALPKSGERETWRVVTGDGSVTLRVPSDFKANLDAHTGDGRISLDFPVEVSGTFRRTEVRGTMNGGGAALRVRTGDGSIRIGKL
jgi:DUF4097 and DUF4098 domain-containing protein YvlB